VRPESPRTRPEILQALSDVEREVAAFFGSLSGDELVLRVGEAWTPAEHLAHLNAAVAAVARGLAVPRWLLRLRFGRARGPSRPYEELRETYRARLAEGGRATGEFVPPREDPPAAAVEERRAEVLARWGRVNARLRGALEGWSERDLDRILLPHPLLGKLTTREMLFFTLYHNQHHIAAARRRLPRFAA
jgi:hypothetical protein